ncbi:hypothetical protein KIW84_013083 [Lathyrus oleraceus]|uniref:Uncharacterized protein n=1 Tax=Pisum sativum TaxID=3888 RepID=A0A9D5BJC8_PEA|nr:hypothetical protein KIW84_013083 [Pisum sativum]
MNSCSVTSKYPPFSPAESVVFYLYTVVDNLPCEYVLYVLTVIDNISHALFGRSLLFFPSRVRFVSLLLESNVHPILEFAFGPLLDDECLGNIPQFTLWSATYYMPSNRSASDDFGCLISLTFIPVLDIHSSRACCSLTLIPVFRSHDSLSLLPSNRSKVPKPSSSDPLRFCFAKGAKERDSKLHNSKVPLPTTSSVVSISDVTKVTRSGRVFGSVFPKNMEDSSVSKKVGVFVVYSVSSPKCKAGESGGLKPNDDDELLKLIKKCEFNMVEQLLQTPSKISVLSLLKNLEAYREALFYGEELPEEGRSHNLALHISMNCKEDVLSNILVDTGSSLNVFSKSTLSRLSYEGAPMRYSGVIVKAFDSSRKTVIGEVDLPVKIGPSDFQITFQVMDIHPTYSCLLGRPWIHEAGVVTSTLHQKLKFVKNGKLVIVGGEKALLVSHLSSFSYVEVDDEIGTPFQALSIVEEKRVGAPMSSYKYAKKIVEEQSLFGVLMGFISGQS